MSKTFRDWDCEQTREYPPYHPLTLKALLLSDLYPGGLLVARIAKARQERVDFKAVTEMQRPNFRTLGEFHQRHLAPPRGTSILALHKIALTIMRRKSGMPQLL